MALISHPSSRPYEYGPEVPILSHSLVLPRGHSEKRGALAGAGGRATMMEHHSYELAPFVFLLSSVICQRAYECRPA